MFLSQSQLKSIRGLVNIYGKWILLRHPMHILFRLIDKFIYI